ncbi:hypothetical protein [Bacillus litorisediminis]|uniref:hypothetical protein n=1 Tax=Bacillus litorisediminis TaxID=2922713 RepID=UPI001FACCB14|nr:hypothetical protein [Bacillus litorisediminis]
MKTFKGKWLKDLISLDQFDEHLLANAIGPLKQWNNENILSLTTHLPKRGEYFYGELRYCKTCMKNGFHSLFHQFTLLSICPFHPKKQLRKGCPKCRASFYYEFSDRNKKGPFQCICGHWFCNFKMDKPFFMSWKFPRKIENSNFKKWLVYNDRETSDVLLIDPYKDSNSYDQILDFYVSSIEGFEVPNSTTINSHSKIMNIQCRKKESTHLSPIMIEEVNSDEIYRITKSVFKSVARHIRKKYLKEHKDCVRHYRRMSQTRKDIEDSLGFYEEVCPYSYAYIHWRAQMEQWENFWRVDDHKLKHFRNYDYGPYLNHEFLNELFFQWKAKELSISCGVVSSHWIFSNILARTSLHSFYQWLKYTPHILKQGYNHYGNINRLEEEPLFSIIVPIDVKRELKITFLFYENRPDFTQLLCPFILSKSLLKTQEDIYHQYWDSLWE